MCTSARPGPHTSWLGGLRPFSGLSPSAAQIRPAVWQGPLGEKHSLACQCHILLGTAASKPLPARHFQEPVLSAVGLSTHTHRDSVQVQGQPPSWMSLLQEPSGTGLYHRSCPVHHCQGSQVKALPTELAYLPVCSNSWVAAGVVFPWVVPPQGPCAGTGQWPLSQVSRARLHATDGSDEVSGFRNILSLAGFGNCPELYGRKSLYFEFEQVLLVKSF